MNIGLLLIVYLSTLTMGRVIITSVGKLAHILVTNDTYISMYPTDGDVSIIHVLPKYTFVVYKPDAQYFGKRGADYFTLGFGDSTIQEYVHVVDEHDMDDDQSRTAKSFSELVDIRVNDTQVVIGDIDQKYYPTNMFMILANEYLTTTTFTMNFDESKVFKICKWSTHLAANCIQYHIETHNPREPNICFGAVVGLILIVFGFKLFELCRSKNGPTTTEDTSSNDDYSEL